MTCPHGHSELALLHMLTGPQATRPCPKCGEAPQFGGVAMSIGMLGGGLHLKSASVYKIGMPIYKFCALSIRLQILSINPYLLLEYNN